MPIVIEPMTPKLFETLPEFASRVWDFPESRQFLEWMFVSSPRSKVIVSHVDGRWLAALGLFEKDYLIEGVPSTCHETYAWASLQTNESKGQGIKVMKAAAALGRPLVALGGSPDTEEFMPRLGFDTVAQAPSLSLPLSARALEATGAKATLAKIGITTLAPILRPHHPKRGNVRTVPCTSLSRDVLNAPTLPGFQACFDQDFFIWQNIYTEQGTFLPFRFLRDGEPAGWTFARVAEEAKGVLVGRILECKFATWTSRSDRRHMMQVVSATLAGFGVAVIRALTSCPDTVTALKSLRFVSGRVSPVMIFKNGVDLSKETIRVSVLRADGGLLPLPPRAQILARTEG